MMKQTIILLALSSTTITVLAAEPAANRPSVERMAHACAGCHGTYGHSQPPTPALAGKSEEKFVAAMREFKSGERVSSIMNRIASGYTDDDFIAMAQLFKDW